MALAFLASLVLLLGTETVGGSSIERPIPEALAFSAPLAAQPAPESSAPAPWSETEVLSRYDSAFVELVLVQCRGSDVVRESTALGLAVDEQNLVFEAGSSTTDVVWVPSRSIGGVPAIATHHPSGVAMATTEARMSRHVELVSNPVGEPHLLVGKSLFSKARIVSEISDGPGRSIVVSVSTEGEVLEIYVQGERLARSTLTDIGEFVAATDGSSVLPEGATRCDRGGALRLGRASATSDVAGPR